MSDMVSDFFSSGICGVNEEMAEMNTSLYHLVVILFSHFSK